MELVVSNDGIVRCVYNEALDLRALGMPDIRRASFVEPDDAGQWWADLLPVDGPKLGPFDGRGEALAAEMGWLTQHWLIHPEQFSNPRSSNEGNFRPDRHLSPAANHWMPGSALCDGWSAIQSTTQRRFR